MINGIGMTEILIISFMLMLFFGAKKLPELAKGIGTSVKELKNAVKE